MLDLLAAEMLSYCRPVGLALGAAIILSDVAINSCAFYALALPFGFLRSSFRSCSATSCSALSDF